MGAIFASGLTLLTMMSLARILNSEDYGKFILIQSSVGMVGVLAGFGIGTTSIRYVAELKVVNPFRLGKVLALTERVIFIFSIIASLLLIISSSFISSNLLNTPSLRIPLQIAGFSIFFSAIDAYQKSVLVGFEKMKVLAKGTLLGVILGAPIIYFLTVFLGLVGAALGLVLMAIVQCIISRYQMITVLNKSQITKDADGCFIEWKVLRDFSFPALLSSLMIAPAHWTSQVLLANTEFGFTQVAIIGVAMQWFYAVQFIPTAAGRVILPILTERLALKDNFKAVKLLKITTITNFLVILIIAVLAIYLSPFFIRGYGFELNGAKESLNLILMIAVLVVSSAPTGQMLAASNKMWIGVAMNAGWAVIYIAGCYMLLDFGAFGVVMALGIAYLFLSSWVAIWTWNYIKINSENKTGLKTTL
jgi:O-antigen/teichoic acid export membrane protein